MHRAVSLVLGRAQSIRCIHKLRSEMEDEEECDEAGLAGGGGEMRVREESLQRTFRRRDGNESKWGLFPSNVQSFIVTVAELEMETAPAGWLMKEVVVSVAAASEESMNTAEAFQVQRAAASRAFV